MKDKIKELSKKHNVPHNLLIEAIKLEKDRVVLKNRQLVPKIIQLIEEYSEVQEEQGLH